MFNQFLCGLELISGDLRTESYLGNKDLPRRIWRMYHLAASSQWQTNKKMSFSQPQTVEGLGQFGCVQPIKKIDQPMFENLLASYIPTWRIISPTSRG
jgi:hypothetical protein